jgi:hypothetical protein
MVPLAIHTASTSEPAAPGVATNATGSTAGMHLRSTSQRLRPSYTVSPAGQRLKRRAPQWEPRKRSPRTRKAPPHTLPLRSGSVAQAERSSVLLRWWRLVARLAVDHGEQNQDDDHRSAPQNPSVLKKVHGYLLCCNRNRRIHDNRYSDLPPLRRAPPRGRGRKVVLRLWNALLAHYWRTIVKPWLPRGRGPAQATLYPQALRTGSCASR